MKAFGIFPLCVGLFLLGTIHITKALLGRRGEGSKHIGLCLVLLNYFYIRTTTVWFDPK